MGRFRVCWSPTCQRWYRCYPERTFWWDGCEVDQLDPYVLWLNRLNGKL